MSRNTNSDPDEKRRQLLAEIEEAVIMPVHIMAVCSGYKVTIKKYQLDKLLPKHVHIHYGPGCPACLASPSFIDKLVGYSKRSNVIIATYSDLVGIPGSKTTLEKARISGADIRVVGNIWDVLLLAKKNSQKAHCVSGQQVSSQLLRPRQQLFCKPK